MAEKSVKGGPGKDVKGVRMQEKIEKAKQWDTRVVIVKTVDVHRGLDILEHTDRGIRVLRGGLAVKFDADKTLDLLKEYNDVLVQLNDVTERMCKVAGVDYFAPKWIAERAPAGGNGGGA